MKTQTIEPGKRDVDATLPSEGSFGNSKAYGVGTTRRLSLRPVKSMTKRQSIRPLPVFKKEKDNSSK